MSGLYLHPSSFPDAFADGIDGELDHCSMKAKARCDKLADGIAFLVTRHTHTQTGSTRISTHIIPEGQRAIACKIKPEVHRNQQNFLHIL
jgi:hypothetical protein